MIQTFKTAFATLICLFAINVAFSQAPVVTINFNPVGLTPGSTIHVPIVMSGTQVGSWVLLIHYNTTALTYVSTANTVSSLGFFGAVGNYAGLPPFSPPEQLFKASLGYTGGSPGATYANQTIMTIDFTYNGGDPDLYFKYISSGTSGNNVSYIMANPYTVVNTGAQFVNPFLVGSISASQTICYNTAPAQLTGVAPTGGLAPYTYQWQSSTNNVSFNDIPGATVLDYTPGSLTANAYFRQHQTSADMQGTRTTNVVSITVNPAFAVGSVAASQSICPGSTPAELIGTAPTGGWLPYSYQWESSSDGVTFSPISGANIITYQPGALSTATYFRQVQTSSGSCGSFNTNAVRISMNPTIVAGVIAASQTICSGSVPALLTATAPSGTSPTYQWESSLDDVTFTTISGATLQNYQPGALTTTTYYRQEQNASGVCFGPATTNVVAVNVLPHLLVGTVTANQTICTGTSAALLTATAPSTGTSPTYQWQSSLNNVTFNNIAGATALTYQPDILTATTYFKQIQAASGVCNSPQSTNIVTVIVNPNLAVGSISASQSICSGNAPAQLNGVAPSTGTSPVYQWQSSLDDVSFSNISGATLLNYQPGALTTVTYYRQSQNASSTCGGPLNTNTVTISLNPNLLVGSISASQTICQATAPALLHGVAPSNGTSPTYQWQNSPDDVTFTNISGATNINYQPGTLSSTTYYRQLQNATGTCLGPLPTNVITVTVTPNLVVGTISANQVICKGVTPALLTGTAPSTGTAPTYQWQSSIDNVSFGNISGATLLNYQPGALTATTYYRQEQNTTGTCLGPLPTNVVTITVNADFVVGSISASQSICAGNAPSQLNGVAPNGTSPVYQWQVSNDDVSFIDIIGATQLNYQPGVLTSVTYYKQRQNSSSTCGGPLFTNTLTISVNPNLIVGSISASQTICGGNTPALLTGVAPSNGTSPVYQWQSSLNNVTFANISGATALNYQPGVTTATTYYRLLQNASGTCLGPLPTNVVTVSFYPNLIVGSIGSNQSICAGSTPLLLTGVAPSNGTSPTFQWQSSVDNVTYANISGATFINYQPGAITATTYFKQLQNASGTCGGPLATNVVTITFYPNLLVGSVSASQTICIGTAPALLTGTAPLNGTSPTYQWQSSLDNSSFTNISGATLINYQPNVLGATTYFRALQNASNTCGGPLTTNVVTITVNPLPVATAINNGPLCVGATLNLTGGPAGMTTYAWSGPNGFTSALQSPTIPSVTAAAAGTYSLVVTNASGCVSVAATTTVVVNALPVATATNSGPVCAGSTLTLTGGPAAMTTYAWTGPNGFTSALQNPTIANVTAAAAGVYSLIVTNSSGCVSTAATTTVVVNARPIATATNNGPVCVGATLTLTGGPAGMTTYAWTGPNGFTSALQSPSITGVTAAAAGAYNLVVTNSTGCTSIAATTTAVINALPVATASNNGPVCVGSTVTLTGGPAGMTTYAWTGPNGFTSSVQNPTIANATAAAGGVYSLIVTNSSGCVSTAATTTVVISTGPVATASNNGPLCEGATLNLIGGPSGMAYYLWSGPNGYTSNVQNPVIPNATAATGGMYTLLVTNASGCSGAASTTVTVNPIPVATATNNGPLCAGATLNLTGGPANMSTYAWSGPNGFTANVQSPSIANVTTAAAGVYSLQVSFYGCTSIAATTTVVVNAKPVATATNNGPVCEGSTLSLTGGPSGMASYAWSGPNGFTSGVQNPTIANATAAASGVYTLNVSSSSGCSSSATTTAVVNAKPPTPVVTANGFVLTSSAASGNQWYYNGTAIAGATGQTYTVTHNTGYYWVVVTLNGCSSDISNKVYIEVVGTEELPIDASFTIYPVPNSGIFTASIQYPVETTFNIYIFNQLGAQIFELKDVRTTNGKYQKLIDLRPIPAGIYSVVFLNSEFKVVRKVVVNK